MLLLPKVNDWFFSLPPQVCLGEVDKGKKFADVEVGEIGADVAKVNAKDDPARTIRYTGENWKGKKIARTLLAQGFFL